MNTRSAPPPDPLLRTAILVIASVLFFAALRAGAEIFAPLVLALVTGVILAPIMDRGERLGLPRGVLAMGVLIFGISAIAFLVLLLEPIFWRVLDTAPQIRAELRGVIDDGRRLLQGLDEVNREVERTLGTEAAPAEGNGGEEGDSIPSVRDALVFAPVILSQILIFIGALFFFLLTRIGIYEWMSRHLGAPEDTKAIHTRFSSAERVVSRYFLTITVINAGLGVALASILLVLGLPAPIFWGVAAALMNFLLYVGPAIIAVGLTLAALISFDGIAVAAPVAAYLTLNMIEAQFVTPTFVGRHVSVNPLLVFVSLVFWMWLWGPIGAIVAIPVLVAGLALTDRI